MIRQDCRFIVPTPQCISVLRPCHIVVAPTRWLLSRQSHCPIIALSLFLLLLRRFGCPQFSPFISFLQAGILPPEEKSDSGQDEHCEYPFQVLQDESGCRICSLLR